MTQTFIGTDYQGFGCVKLTKGELDPAATLDSEVGAFLFNSNWSKDVKLEAINLLPFVASSTYRPQGSTIGTYTWYTNSASSTNLHYMRSAYYPDMPYKLPLFDLKAIRNTNGRFVTNVTYALYLGVQDRGGRWSSAARGHFGWAKDFYPSRTDTGTLDYGTEIINTFSTPSGSSEVFSHRLVLWRLPGDEAPILDGEPKAPVVGQDVVEITKSACRASKPGYDVRTATRTQMAFDSSYSPTKIIAAADIAIPSGYTEYDTGFSLPANTVVDVHFYQGSDVYYPANPSDTGLGAEHWIEGSRLCFNNTYSACRARFIVIAFDDTPVTSGDNEVFRQFSVGGEDVVQFLRPGSGDPPSFADIVLDSRWPCLQILAEGYIPVTADGAQLYTVNFNGEGTFPFVKYMTVHGSGTYAGATWSKRVRVPYVSRVGLAYGSPGWQIWDAGDSTYCRFTQHQAVFRTFRGAPIEARFPNANSFPNNPTLSYDPSPIQGIRYYIFGIPQP